MGCPVAERLCSHFFRNTSSDPGSIAYAGITNPDLIGELTEWNPDAILVYGWRFKSHFQVMRHFKGRVPIWFRGDSHLLDETPGFRRFLRRVALTWMYQHVDTAVYCGKDGRAYFLRHGVRETSLAYVPHSVDNDFFAANAGETKCGRANCGKSSRWMTTRWFCCSSGN